MPTLAALETALADYKRTEADFQALADRQTVVLAQLKTIQGQMETAKASFSANEEALRSVAAQFARAVR